MPLGRQQREALDRDGYLVTAAALDAAWRARLLRAFEYADFVVTTIWMLDDFAPDNGATRVIPGSHRSGPTPPKAMAQPLSVHPRELVVTGAAGSVLIFNGHLWHSGRRNDSRRQRRAAQMVLLACDAQGKMPASGSA